MCACVCVILETWKCVSDMRSKYQHSVERICNSFGWVLARRCGWVPCSPSLLDSFRIQDGRTRSRTRGGRDVQRERQVDKALEVATKMASVVEKVVEKL